MSFGASTFLSAFKAAAKELAGRLIGVGTAAVPATTICDITDYATPVDTLLPSQSSSTTTLVRQVNRSTEDCDNGDTKNYANEFYHSCATKLEDFLEEGNNNETLSPERVISQTELRPSLSVEKKPNASTETSTESQDEQTSSFEEEDKAEVDVVSHTFEDSGHISAERRRTASEENYLRPFEPDPVRSTQTEEEKLLIPMTTAISNRRLEAVIAPFLYHNEMVWIAKFEDCMAVEFVPGSLMNEFFPQTVIGFYERRLCFERSVPKIVVKKAQQWTEG